MKVEVLLVFNTGYYKPYLFEVDKFFQHSQERLLLGVLCRVKPNTCVD